MGSSPTFNHCRPEPKSARALSPRPGTGLTAITPPPASVHSNFVPSLIPNALAISGGIVATLLCFTTVVMPLSFYAVEAPLQRLTVRTTATRIERCNFVEKTEVERISASLPARRRLPFAGDFPDLDQINLKGG